MTRRRSTQRTPEQIEADRISREEAARLANAVARMDPDQLWALRVTVATERRLRTHYQPPTYPDGPARLLARRSRQTSARMGAGQDRRNRLIVTT